METNKKKLKQLEAEYASIKKRHEKGKNAVSRKTSAKRKTIQYVADLTELPEETIHELAQNITSKKIL